MSWLMENWFGEKNSLEQVREEIPQYIKNEVYLGVSGLENPEQSANRVAPKDLFLVLHGPWGKKLEENEAEFLQVVHDALPPVVRDEVGIIPFFTTPTQEGYLVLAFIRNASTRDIAFYKLPLSLVNEQGEVLAENVFDMKQFGSVGDMTSRTAEFLFAWKAFKRMPKEGEELSLRFDAPVRKRVTTVAGAEGTLTPEEREHYTKVAIERKLEVIPGQVKLDALDLLPANDGAWKVIALFRNGLEKHLEFTEVPIQLRDRQGKEVGVVRFGLKNLRVEPKSSLIWGFLIPSETVKKANVDLSECTAFIDDPVPKKSLRSKQRPRGMVQ